MYVQWMNLLFHKSDTITYLNLLCSHNPSASGSYGKQSDEILLYIFKIVYIRSYHDDYKVHLYNCDQATRFLIFTFNYSL